MFLRVGRHRKEFNFKNLLSLLLLGSAEKWSETHAKCRTAKHKICATKIGNTEAGTFCTVGCLQFQKTSKVSGRWIYRNSFLVQR